jgi:hypothetical protein
LATTSNNRLVMGSLRSAFLQVSFPGSLDPTAPFVNDGTCASAAGAA